MALSLSFDLSLAENARKSDKEATLPSLPLLRTVLATFTAQRGSSLWNAPQKERADFYRRLNNNKRLSVIDFRQPEAHRLSCPSNRHHLLSSIDRFNNFSCWQRPTPKSARFHAGWCFNPYLCHNSTAFTFSVIPYLQFHRLILRFAFPCGRITGNPAYRLITTDGLGSAFSPVARHLRRKRIEFPVLATHLLVTA